MRAIEWFTWCGAVWSMLCVLAIGCATQPPFRTPDIVEIEIPVPVMAPFDCSCQCQPHKELEIEMEGGTTYFLPSYMYNPAWLFDRDIGDFHDTLIIE